MMVSMEHDHGRLTVRVPDHDATRKDPAVPSRPLRWLGKTILAGVLLGGVPEVCACLTFGFSRISIRRSYGLPQLHPPVAVLESAWLWGLLAFILAARQRNAWRAVIGAMIFLMLGNISYYGVGVLLQGPNRFFSNGVSFWAATALLIGLGTGVAGWLYAFRRPWSPLCLIPVIAGIWDWRWRSGHGFAEAVPTVTAAGVLILMLAQLWLWRPGHAPGRTPPATSVEPATEPRPTPAAPAAPPPPDQQPS